MEHFRYYPTVEYLDQIVTNICVRGRVRDSVLNNTFIYYRHTVADFERPDIIASKYYGNASYTWAIFYANDIFDPIADWPLTDQQFVKVVAKKYGSVPKALITPHHYLLDNQYEIDKPTYEDVNLSADRKKMITQYDYEHDLNESKRQIKIIDAVFIRQLTNELSVLLKK